MVESVISSVPINCSRKWVNLLDVQANLFITKLADLFREKNLIKLPSYATSALVKCSHSNELSPLDANWFFHKAAAVARQIYVSKSKTLGVGSLRSVLGKKQRRWRLPCVTSRGGGKIIRDIVTQLRKLGYVENFATTENSTLGLTLTGPGIAQLDKVAARCLTKK